MTLDVAGLVTICLTLTVHLVATTWWAASITKRVDYLERWITSHEHTAERLAALEQQLASLTSGIVRVESLLRQRQ